MLSQIIDIKERDSVLGIEYAEVLVRFFNGKTQWHLMNKSEIDFRKWLWSVKDKLAVTEIVELERIVQHLIEDAINEQDID